MPRQLEFAAEAQLQLESILDYLAESFQVNVLARFLDRWMFFAETVKEHPLRYPYYGTQDGIRLHKAVVLEMTVVLFSFTDAKVTVQAVFDARSDWQNQS